MKNHQYKLGFMDSETFTAKRPEGLTKKQRDAVLISLAQEIVENGWVDEDYLNYDEDDYEDCDDDIEDGNPYGIYSDIVEDLESISTTGNGYEMAKSLENNKNCCYDIDADFVSWLEDFEYNFIRAKHENIKAWVAAHGIKPKYPVGSVFTTTKDIHKNLPAGTTLYINSIYSEYAQYCVWSERDSKRNVLVNFEDLENSICIIS